MSLLKFKAFDESGVCEITYFNQNFLKNVFTVGSEFRFYGKVEKKGKNYFAICPFHDDHNPSMSISSEKQIFTCCHTLVGTVRGYGF
jgi:RecG-like helicase